MSLHIFYHPLYSSLTLPERHRFPLAKYQGLFSQLQAQGYPLAKRPWPPGSKSVAFTMPIMSRRP